jgi:hypothetical protein
VRGIAGEQQPAPAPGLGDERVEGVDGGALELGLSQRSRSCQTRAGATMSGAASSGSTAISQRRRFSGPRT